MSVRKKYAKEFKLDAVSLVLDQGYTQAKREEAWASIPTCWAAGSGSINPVMVGRFRAMAR